MKNIFLLIFILFSLNCNHGIDHSNLSIGFWNVENLFDLIDDPDKRDEEFALNGRKNVTQEIYNLKIKNSVEVLRDLDVDILGLCEVENKNVLNASFRSCGSSFAMVWAKHQPAAGVALKPP